MYCSCVSTPRWFCELRLVRFRLTGAVVDLRRAAAHSRRRPSAPLSSSARVDLSVSSPCRDRRRGAPFRPVVSSPEASPFSPSSSVLSSPDLDFSRDLRWAPRTEKSDSGIRVERSLRTIAVYVIGVMR